jgi:hypothetical protein
MGTISRGVRATAAIALLWVASVSAQDAPRGLAEVREGGRHGFWAAVGLGAGGESYDLRDGAGYSGELYKPTVSLRLGGTVSQELRLGGELLAWVNENGPAVETLTSALFIAQLYPVSATGLYLKGGLGIGRNEVDFPDDGYFGVGDTGFAGLVGAGWELRLGRRLFLNPAIDLVGHSYTGRSGERYRERLVNFGLSIGYQTAR